MPLSEHEQRVLDDLERDLGTDPKLKGAMGQPHRTAGQLAIAAAGVVIGLGVVLTGVMTKIWFVGIGGFAVMITVVLWALLGPATGTRPASRRTKPKGKDRQGFMMRLEERFERRREQGDV